MSKQIHTVAVFREIEAVRPNGFGKFGIKLDSVVPFIRKAPEAELKRITEGTPYSGLKANRISENAMEAVSGGRLVWAEVEGGRRLGYYHMNPEGSRGGFVEITASVDKRSTIAGGTAILGRSRIFASEIQQGCLVSDSSIKGSTVEGNSVVQEGRLANEFIYEGSMVSGGRENYPTS